MTTSYPSTATTVVGTTNLLASNLGARAAAIALNFEMFRIKFMRVSQVTDSANAILNTNLYGLLGCLQAVAFDPEVSADTTTPTTLTQAAQFGHFSLGNVRDRIGFALNSRDLFGSTPGKWYHTAATGSPNADSLSAGTLYQFAVQNGIGGGTQSFSGQVTAVMSGIVQFRGMVTTALSFARLQGALGDLQRTYADPSEDSDEKTMIVVQHDDAADPSLYCGSQACSSCHTTLPKSGRDSGAIRKVSMTLHKGASVGPPPGP